MATPVGITVPKLLPVTGTFALPFTAYFLLLSGRVVQKRLQDEHYVGDNSSKSSDPAEKQFNPLYVDTRCHSNFVENIPLAFLLAAIVELNGGNRKALTGGLGALLALRIFHTELGLRGKEGMAFGRPIGYFGTMGVIAALGGYASYLVKSYWGF